MEKRVEIISLFSTPIVKINIARDFTKDELQLLLEDLPISKFQTSNHRSNGSYLFDDFVELKNLKNFCEYHLKQYLEDIKGADTDLATLRITQSWLNKIKPHEYQHSHSHPDSYLSGVLYISCLSNDSINFNNRMYGMFNNIEFSIKKVTAWNSTGTTINVKEGDLIIFPSWVLHHVDMNNTDKERISLAFNSFPIGEIGTCRIVPSHLKL